MLINFHKPFKFLLLIVLCFSINGCFAVKSVPENITAFKGNVNGDVSFKYFLEKDTNNNFRIRVYDITGIKLGDFLIDRDSLRIKYIIDNSYNDMIIKFFKNNNPKFCFYELINEMYFGNLFISNSNNYNCFLKEITNSSRDNVTVALMTRKYEKFANIEASKFINISNRMIPSKILLTMNNGSNYKISIDKK